MIPYSTCMRFNQTRRHSFENDNNNKYSPCEWTLVQHFGNKTVNIVDIDNILESQSSLFIHLIIN